MIKMKNLRDKLNNKVNRLSSVSNRIDSSKVELNNRFNDVPSADEVVNQKKLEPNPTKSTIGLLGFEQDQGTIEDKVLKSQVINENEVRSSFLNQQFGTIQVNHKGSGGTQTKSIQVAPEMAQTFDQRKLLALSEETKSRLGGIFKKLTGENTVAIQKATHDDVVDPQGKKDLKRQIKSSSRTRLKVDSLNEFINQVIGNISSKKKGAKAKQESSIPEKSELFSLDSPLKGRFE